MSSPEFRRARMPHPRRLGFWLVTVFVLSVFLIGSAAHGEVNPGLGRWWLPPVHSEHGPAVDTLFYVIFWITMITFVVVEGVLVIFLVKYRSRPDRKKAHFTHGNSKLEMGWTIAPSILLAVLALWSKKAWDDYRYAPSSDDPNRAVVLAIGQQFKWNFIYPGPDGKLGKYLLYPHPADAKWPVGPDGKEQMFDGVPGPASLPYEKAIASINKYIDGENPLGKDFSDPNGADDNWEKAPARGLILPAHRPIEVQLSSKDVIHDFFLPNFRVKLDAVPGMRGHLFFTATMSSTERSLKAARDVSLDDLPKLLDSPEGKSAVIIIDETSPGSDQNRDLNRGSWRYFGGDDKATIIRNGGSFQDDPDDRKDQIAKLRAAGLTTIRMTTDAGQWELVCEELCGQGHNTMNAPLTILSNEEYDKKNFDKPYKPSTQPAQAAIQ